MTATTDSTPDAVAAARIDQDRVLNVGFYRAAACSSDAARPYQIDRFGRNYLFKGEEASRYTFDFDLCAGADWIQYDTDQDAWYFGVWVNVEARQTVTFAEGDLTICSFPDLESFRAELQEMQEFYGSPPPAAIVYDTDEDGRTVRTEVFDANARPQV